MVARLRQENRFDTQEIVPASPAQEDGTFLSIGKKLMFIVLKHQDERDPLSNRLFMKGSDFRLPLVISLRSLHVYLNCSEASAILPSM